MKNILKTGLLTLIFGSSIGKGDSIPIAMYSEWKAGDEAVKIKYLQNALNTMRGKDKLRLVITEDKKGWFSDTKGEVYVSDQTGESTLGYGAWEHNKSTWKNILNLYKTILEAKGVEEKKINDSLDLLLPQIYGDIESLYKLVGKDINFNHLENILKIISEPYVLYIKAEPVEEKINTELSGSNQDTSVKPTSKVLAIVNQYNAIDEKAKKEQDILNGKVK